MNDTTTVFDNFRKFAVSVRRDRNRAAVDAMLIAIEGYSTMLVPVDIGNLANSIFRDLYDRGNSWAGVVYYTAKYAPWVHEMSGKLRGQPRAHFGATRSGVEFGGGTGVGNYWDGYAGPSKARPKFLALAVEEMILKDFDRIIRENY